MTDVRRVEELWDAAAEVAAAKGTLLQATVRECLARSVRRTRRRQWKGHHDAPRH